MEIMTKKQKRQSRLVKAWVKNNSLSVMDMYDKCYEEGWMDYLVETRESIKFYILDKVQNDYYVAPLLQSIEDNNADLFVFDVTGFSNTKAVPIYDKKKLAEAMGY